MPTCAGKDISNYQFLEIANRTRWLPPIVSQHSAVQFSAAAAFVAFGRIGSPSYAYVNIKIKPCLS